MHISSLIDSSAIIPAAFALPVMKINPRSKKRPDIDVALKCVVNQIETATVEAVAAEVFERLEEAYEMFVLMNGERPVVPQKVADPTPEMVAAYHRDFPAAQKAAEDWDDLADAMVEEAIEPYKEHLSANWLGEFTIGTALHLKDGVKLFAEKLAKEYYREIIKAGYDEKQKKTPAQIMSSAGITKAEVETALELHLNPTEEEQKVMAEQQNAELQDVAKKIADHIGKDFDVMKVYDDLEIASDDDDLLSEGAAARIGIDMDDVNVLRMERLSIGTDVVDVVLKMIEEVNEGGSKKKGKGKGKGKAKETPADAPAEVAAPKPPKTPAKAPSSAEVVNVEVLQALRASGAKDDEMAKGVGVSRATYNGYVQGKVEFKPNDAQLSFIRGELVTRANALLEAIGTVDNAEPHMVF